MEQRIFVLYSLLEDANALPISYTDVFDSKEEAKEAMIYTITIKEDI